MLDTKELLVVAKCAPEFDPGGSQAPLPSLQTTE